MKTTILTAAIFFATVLGISQSTFAATTKSHEVSTTLTEVKNINEIEVHGNVQLYVTSGTADEVKVYNSYYGENAMVQDEKGVLRISSYSANKLVVWVTVNNLNKLSAYDNAEVKSFGKLSAINLDVKLYNDASAKLDMDTYTADITLNGHAKGSFTGDVTTAKVNYDQFTKINIADLKAAHLTKTMNAFENEDNLATL